MNKKCFQSHLAKIENDADRNFLSQFFQVEVSNLTAAFRNIGIWIGGHSVLNYTEATYVWKPENYLITKFYWKNDEPNIYIDYTNVCVYIDDRSLYLDWATTLCTDEKYYICQRDVTDTEKKEMFAQCYCPPEYSGTFCEKAVETGNAKELQQVICSNEKLNFSCSSGEIIQVDFATFGNIGEVPSHCKSLTSEMLLVPQSDFCANPESLQRITALCEGLRECTIPSIPSHFPKSPCFGTPTSLTYRFQCVEESQSKCPGDGIYYNGRCYRAYFATAENERLTWEQAQQSCLKKSGILASITDETLHELVVNSARTYSDSADYWVAVWTNDDSDIIVGNNKTLGFVPGGSTIVGKNKCVAYKITETEAIWMSEECNSTKNWICESPPERETRAVEEYKEREREGTVFIGTPP
ncbi:unnamed protein product [Enterobius vermicularis]|uniref:C-type lectin domain-containing protein n=1 Tax=Enterobius vermicularis TaxID=51028 RepID=A0A0N4VAZ6_ENTVE|nr:unnamed protein product [Enterobius vermicularis]